MKLFRLLKKVNFRNFLRLLSLAVKNMRFLYPTFLATKECLSISTQHFGTLHHQNGPANAFRHAFWNFLIAKKCSRWSHNMDRILQWTKAITDWHENTFKNRQLPRIMDFHNNAVGRIIFKQNHEWSQEQFLNKFLQLTQEAVKISSTSDLTQRNEQLVCLTDDQTS